MSGLLFTKRNFLKILAGGVATGEVLNNAAQAQLLTTGVILGKPSRGLALYDGIAATRGTEPSNLSAFVHLNVRSGHFARNDITQLKILVPNWYNTELAPGAAMSIAASVEYPPGVYTQLLFSASATGTIPDGTHLYSDYLTISIPNYAKFWIRMFLQNAAGVPVLAAAGAPRPYIDNEFMGDAMEDSASDHTMSGNIPNSILSQYHPTVIAPITAPAVLILGDSIALGVRDESDISGDEGIIARTVGPLFGYLNCGQDADTAANFVAAHTQRLVALDNCSYVFVQYGRNDIYIAGDSKATVEANLSTIYGLCSTKPVKQLTYVPDTDSSDGWVTTMNQSIGNAGKETIRSGINSDLTTMMFGPPEGFSDTGAVLTTATNLWVPNDTDDGIHPDHMGYLAAQTSGAISTALIGTPAILTTETGSTWGDVGTGVAVSTMRTTNDTVTGLTGGVFSTARGAQGRSTGLRIFEIELYGAFGGICIGLMNNTTGAGAGMDTFPGNIDDSYSSFSSGGAFAFVPMTIFTAIFSGAFDISAGGIILRIGADFTNKFSYLALDNVWLNSGDPTSGAMGTGAVASWTGTPTLFPAFGISVAGFGGVDNPARIRTGNTLEYPMPAGGWVPWG